MLVSFRANERRKEGQNPWANQDVLQDDIARSAEMIEVLFVAAKEEAVPAPEVLVAHGIVNHAR